MDKKQLQKDLIYLKNRESINICIEYNNIAEIHKINNSYFLFAFETRELGGHPYFVRNYNKINIDEIIGTINEWIIRFPSESTIIKNPSPTT